MRFSPVVSDLKVQEFLREHPEWSLEQGMLVRTWSFADFKESMAFVNRVAFLAEESRHHPDIDIRYNRVRLALISHDAQGITARDTAMAHRLSVDPSRPSAWTLARTFPDVLS